MKLYPMTMIVSESADVTREEVAEALDLNPMSVTLMLKGSAVQVTEDYLETVNEVNEQFAGKVTLLIGEPLDLGGDDEVNLDMNAL